MEFKYYFLAIINPNQVLPQIKNTPTGTEKPSTNPPNLTLISVPMEVPLIQMLTTIITLPSPTGITKTNVKDLKTEILLDPINKLLEKSQLPSQKTKLWITPSVFP